MPALAVRNLNMSFVERTLFTDISFDVESNDKVGFIGANGVGKTTLFRILNGELSPTSGSVTFEKNAKVGYMEQHACHNPEIDVFHELLSVFDYLKDMETEIKRLESEKQSAINSQDYESAATIRDKEKQLEDLLKDEKNKWQNSSNHDIKSVSSEDIAQVVSSWTGVPVSQLTKEESERLLNMESILHERIVGQDKAVSSIAKAIRRGRVGLKNPNRPI